MADDVLSSEMIEVDPKLFITCRLCLEEMGVYQIVPTVQQQIKYCFDIIVEPFDGLPQLLCKKCKGLLDEYSSNKKKYIEKQKSLIAKLKVKQVQNSKSEDKADFIVSSSSFALPHSATATKSRSSNSSSSANKEPIKTTAKEHELVSQPVSINSADNSAYDSECNIRPPVIKSLTKHRKRKSRLMSNSSSGTEESTHSKKKIKKHQSKSLKWRRKYKKQYVCNICSNIYDERRKLKKHFNAHSYIKSKYEYILNKGCRVKLIKSDGKPNITNLNNTIIFDKGKIIQDEGNLLYHILYTERDTDNSSSKAKSKKHKVVYSESSDDDFMVARKDKRKCRRISRSSNETVLLEDTNKTLESCNADDVESSHKKLAENEETECINIDDSSDNNTDLENNANSKQTTETNVEFKTIENIISNCRLKYMKKLELTQNGSNNSSKKMIYSEMQLKHKLLSIGRKNICKDGQINCTGLLRFMEHKNLNVLWLPKDNRESLVRIMPNLKSASDNENTIEKCGWTTLPETGRDTPDINNVSATNHSVELPVIENKSPILSKSNTAINNTESVNTSQTLPLENYAPAILYTDYAADVDLNSKKILNQSPVANPKQLPKKSNVNDSKASKNVADVVNNKSFVIDLDEEQTRQLLEEDNYSVPIITSTTSLADVDKNEKEPDAAKAPDKSVPRIKVKPVSELMNPPSARVNENSNNIWAVNNLANRVTPNTDLGNVYIQLVPQIQNVQSLQIAPAPERNVLPVTRVTSQAPSTADTECIVLNSLELPNTRTDSPFKYLKDLLLIHNIFLLDPNLLITREYLGLLKIKVQFKQESKDVVLCLSLFCLRNAFCICIKDSNNVNIPMTKISANWQWEIIKIFQGDLSNQILNNSMKAGQQVYANTQTFLFLLKSITCNQQ